MAHVISLWMAHNLRKERVFRDRRDPLDSYNDEDLYRLYRFDRSGIFFLCDVLKGNLECATRRNHSIPVHMQIMLILQYFATGTLHAVLSETMNVERSTVTRIIQRTTYALVEKAKDFISFPCNEEAATTKEKFYNIGGFPNVLGAVDGTQIRIISPGGNSAQCYYCRKGYPSINVQVVADADYLIRDIVVKWPGSVHDSRMFRNSGICSQFETGQHDGYLLGDSGYPLKPFLMTPYNAPVTNPQRRYNSAHKRTRVVVEQTFGQWKRRFQCLHSEIRSPNANFICAIICVCAILHNIAKRRNLPDFLEDSTFITDGEEDIHNIPHDEGNAQAVRTSIVMHYFS
jgi:nuclease HARBI1